MNPSRLSASIAAGVIALAAIASPALTSTAWAQHHRDRWHGHYDTHDLALWHGGRWYHGPHSGRSAWWWVVNGVWYPYAVPVYPYPDPYLPPTVAPVAPVPAQTSSYYYCRRPAGYYPYVSVCRVAWESVPAPRVADNGRPPPVPPVPRTGQIPAPPVPPGSVAPPPVAAPAPPVPPPVGATPAPQGLPPPPVNAGPPPSAPPPDATQSAPPAPSGSDVPAPPVHN